MSWENRFAAIELHMGHDAALELDGAVEEMATAENAAVLLGARVAGSLGRDVALILRDGDTLRGKLADAGQGWVELDCGGRRVVATFAAISQLQGAGPWAAPDAGGVAGRRSLGAVLRDLADHELMATVWILGGGRAQGRVARVGADYVEIVSLELDITSSLIPLQAIARITTS